MITAQPTNEPARSPSVLGWIDDGGDTLDKDDLITRQAELLYRSSLPQFSNLINATVVAVVLWDVYPHYTLLAWLGLMMAVVALRVLLWRHFRGSAGASENALWRARLHTVGTGATGLLWGAAASVVFLTDSLLHQFFLAFVIAGMGAGAVASNSAYRPALFAFLLPATAPLALAFLLQGGTVFTAMGLMIVLFIGLLSMIGIYFNRSLVSGFRLQAINERLIERLSQARRVLEDRIAERTAELRRANASLEREITERRTAEEALRLSEDRLLQATQLARLGYCVWDSIEDRCISCSEEHARIHGLDVKRYMALSSPLEGDFSLTHPEDRDAYRAAVRRLRGEGIGFEIEYRVITPEGSVRHVREIVKPLFGEGGKVVREFGTIQDVTDLKQAEAQLRQAMKMQAVGQLAGGMAHDFNNLLGVILANLELISLDEDDPKKPLLDRSIRAVERGADLTRRLLTFTRQQPLNPRVLDINAILMDMDGLLSRTLGEGIELSVSLDPDLWRVMLDPAELESALINLALNARDAMSGGGRLIIETANSPDSASSHGDQAVVTVRDTGTGIEPRHLDKVFEPFFTTKDVGQGSGLGLSMVYGFVERSGGQVTIDSVPDGGTSVRLYFPKSSDQAIEAPDDPSDDILPVGARESILLVEDDDDLRATAETLLNGLGYRVQSAATGEAAMEILRRDATVALLFTDVVLPKGMNGRELAEQARMSRPGLKVLFTSGHTRETDMASGKQSEFGPLLTKPYKKAQLARALRRVMDAGPGPRLEEPLALGREAS